MLNMLRENLNAAGRFVRTPSLGRSIAAMLSMAFALLLAINIATFVMIQRTSDFNEAVERSHAVRTASANLLVRLVDAETGQRGFLLTGRPEYLHIHDAALRELPGLYEQLDRLIADEDELTARLDRVHGLSDQRIELMERTVDLARTGRIGEAVQLIRQGQGKQLMDAMRDEIAQIDALEKARLDARTRQSEWASGLTVFVNALAGLVILALGGVSAWLIHRYITDLQQAQAQVAALNAGLEDKVRERTGALSRANEEIQRFAYIVSHDLRAPLVNVMGYTSEIDQAGQAMARQIDAIEKAQPKLVDRDAVLAVREDVPEAIGFIRASTEKMDRLINAILKLSREGRRSLTPEVLDMRTMVQAIADSVRHQTEAADAVIEVHPLPAIESDRLSMEQIFGNLIDNAVKYLDPARPGRIEVTGLHTPNGVEYRVADNGRGITQRDHERIFELFRRSGRQDRAGEGLGLAFVRNSVRRIGGEITVESELGQGSTFVLTFPKHLIVVEAGDAE